MEVFIIVLLIANLALVAYFLWGISKPQDSQSLMLLQNQMQELTRSLDSKLGEGTTRMFEGMKTQAQAAERLMSTISKQVSDQLVEVVRGVSETKESTKQVFTIAEQLQNLEKVLKHQKQRGNLGEASLELILGNILPPTAFKMQ